MVRPRKRAKITYKYTRVAKSVCLLAPLGPPWILAIISHIGYVSQKLSCAFCGCMFRHKRYFFFLFYLLLFSPFANGKVVCRYFKLVHTPRGRWIYAPPREMHVLDFYCIFAHVLSYSASAVSVGEMRRALTCGLGFFFLPLPSGCPFLWSATTTGCARLVQSDRSGSGVVSRPRLSPR
jgi:hypothetical protein